jgi:hypothetical protein
MNDGWAPSSSATLGDTGNAGAAMTEARIVGFRLGLLTAEDGDALAAKDVTGPAVYERNQPKLDVPIDPAMGTHDRRVQCATCRNSLPGPLGRHPPAGAPVPRRLHRQGVQAAAVRVLGVLPVAGAAGRAAQHHAGREQVPPRRGRGRQQGAVPAL